MIAGAVALALCSISTAYAQSTPIVQSLPDVGDLPHDQVYNANKPVLKMLTSTGAQCAKCAPIEAMLAAHAAAHPELLIVKVSADTDIEEPALSMVVGGHTSWVEKHPSITEDNVDAFLSDRADVGTKEMVLVQKIGELQRQYKEKSQPFNDQLRDLTRQAEEASRDDLARLDAVQAAARKARDPFIRRAKAMAKQLTHLQKKQRQQIVWLEDRADKIAEPYDRRWHVWQEQSSSVCHDLFEEHATLYKTIVNALAPLRSQIAAAEDAHQDELAASLRKQYEEVRVPYSAQWDELEARIKKCTEPYHKKIHRMLARRKVALRKIQHRIEMARSHLVATNDKWVARVQGLKVRADAVNRPYAAQAAAVQDDMNRKLAPIRQQTSKVMQEGRDAVSPIADQYEQAWRDLDALVRKDTKGAIFIQ
jgi:hypothetical protein